MLYLVATPIGNLSDITYRAVETLKSVDYILCEDTRHSKTLLNHYAIVKPLHSFHKFSESQKECRIIEDLKDGRMIALISDAGTPGISDPGEKLVQACVKEGIKVMAIPGPCAAIAALTSSGLSTEKFQFYGFLPKKEKELTRTLKEILTYTGTTVCYESPHRILELLTLLSTIAPDRQVAIARELTKKFEEILRGPASLLKQQIEKVPLKGELVVLIEGSSQIDEQQDWSTLTPQEHVEYMQATFGLSRQEAIPAVAKIRGVSKNVVYNAVHQNKE